jgi:UDP-N-acetylglucosamine--N-acetylmuramyl-(pentapeptide) pyrophosphoryl-undecaprenol N-acetylglucosamine transferase
MRDETQFLPELRGQRMLVVASTGGHLAQAARWAAALQLSPDSSFVSFDTAQSRALLDGKNTFFVDYVPSRGWRQMLSACRRMWQHFNVAGSYSGVLTTGAAVALAAWPVARRHGIQLHYIESVSRFDGPSMTGRVMRRLPGVTTWAQHEYGRNGWGKAPSLLDTYVASMPRSAKDRPLRVLITLGTIRPYRFDRAVDAVLGALRQDDDVIWQLGTTSRDDLPGAAHAEIPGDRMRELMREVDVVVTHAGVGTVLELLDAGQVPIVFTRDARLGEHVDGHQGQISRHLERAELAVVGDAGLTRLDLLVAAGGTVERRTLQKG